MDVAARARMNRIKDLVQEWREGLADRGMSAPNMHHHELGLLLAEAVIDIEERLTLMEERLSGERAWP